jgi:hypothetical protein
VTLRGFRADPDAISPGQATVLRWQVDNASAVYLEGIGPVEACGSLTVRPNATGQYQLIYQNDLGTKKKTARVTVR